MTLIYNQNFESVTPPALPAGWNFDPGITTVAGSLMSGVNCLSVSSTGLKNAFYATQDGVSGNCAASVQVKFTSPGTSSSVHMVTRSSSPVIANYLSSANSYRVEATCGSAAVAWKIIRQNGATATTLLTGNAGLQAALVEGVTYELSLIAVGLSSEPGTKVTLEVKRISDGLYLTTTGGWQATEIACLTFVDTAAPLTGQGYSGLRLDAASGATINADEFNIVNYVDNSNYVKTWSDDSGWTPGLVTVSPSVFGSEAAAVFPADNVQRSFNSGFTDRRWNGALTWTCQFKCSVLTVGTTLTMLFRAHVYALSINVGVGITLVDSASAQVGSTVPFTHANWTGGRTYRVICYYSPTVIRFRIRDTVTNTWLQPDGTFAATDAWVFSATPSVVPNPSQPLNILHQSPTSVVSVGTVTAGPAGTPSASPNPATVNQGASLAITPTMFPGVLTTASAVSGTYSGGNYTAPGSGSSDTLTFAAQFQPSVTVAVPITLTAAVATAYTLTPPSPSSGTVGAASANFTVTPNGTSSNVVTITPSGGGLSTPITVTFDGTAAAKTFTITPTSAGVVTLAPTNNGSLTNPSAVTYTANAVLGTAYVASNGSDSNAGTIGSPFLTVAAAIAGTSAGATINLRGGDTFAEQVLLTSARTITSYGTGRATISRAGNVITITNADGVQIDNLVLTNTTTASACVTFSNTDATRRTAGVAVTNCVISGGSFGIFFGSAAATAGGWNGVTITGNTCSTHAATGIYFSEVGTTAGNKHYSNVLIGDNTVHTIAGNVGTGSGIVIGYVDSVTGAGAARCIVRRNHVYNCGFLCTTPSGPAGMFPIYSDDVLFESNLVHDIFSSSAQTDGAAFDSDSFNTNCVWQYNYAYNVGGAGFLCFSTLGGHIVRWNIFVNCGQSGYPGLGGLRMYDVGSTTVHNNIFHNDPASTVAALYGFNGGATGGKKVYNNIFVSASGVPTVDLPTSLQATFALAGNAYQMGDGSSVALKFNGTTSTSLAAFRTATSRETGTGFTTTAPFVGFADPIPEPTDPATIPTLVGFRVPAGSPLGGAGLDLTQAPYSLASPGTLDFSGATVSVPYSVGAFDAASSNATGYTLAASPGSVATGQASTVTATITGGTALSASLVITLQDSLTSTISGTITIANGSTTGTATVTPTQAGTHALTATHAGGGFAGGDGSTTLTATSAPSVGPSIFVPSNFVGVPV